MNTATPYPTFTPFPTAAATYLNLDPIINAATDSSTIGPQTVQFWQMWIAPHWGLISGILLLILVLVFLLEFFILFKNS